MTRDLRISLMEYSGRAALAWASETQANFKFEVGTTNTSRTVTRVYPGSNDLFLVDYNIGRYFPSGAS